MEEILLGDEVKCKYTGIRGVAMARTEFINGCIQFSVCRKWNPKNPPSIGDGEIGVDSQSLVITKKGPRHKKISRKKVEKKFTGGPMRKANRMRGY